MEQPTTPTGPDVVLRASRLRKDFGDTRAVDDVSITIHAGERVGIVGPNGAGKTTTLLMLLGAIEPDHGTIDIAGHRLPGGRSDAMARVGFAAGYLPLPSGLTQPRGSGEPFLPALQLNGLPLPSALTPA